MKKINPSVELRIDGERNRTINIALLMGGQSAEHEISLATGEMIAGALEGGKYSLKKITVNRDGKWLLPSADRKSVGDGGKSLMAVESGRALEQIKSGKKIDAVFIAMHGTHGEDGTIQGLLELAGIPYTGSGVLASALAIDKAMTKKVLAAENIPMPKHVVLGKDYSAADLEKIKLPAVIKPIRQGSSVGIAIARTKKELDKAVREAFEFDSLVMAEEFIGGREITAAVLGNKKPRALPLIEIRPKISRFFDYKAKYQVGGSEEICPAPVSAALTEKIQEMAVKVHRALGCRGVTRSDFILKGNRPYFLEINTIPGMTKTSLVPQAARQAGISFAELLDELVRLAVYGD